jgi:hypothetical protein
MKIEITANELANLLLQDEYTDWTRAGALALANHYAEFEEQSGEDLTVDVIEIRTLWSELECLEDFGREYFGSDELCKIELDCEDQDQDVIESCIRTFIEANTDLIEFDGGVIVSSF